MKNPSNLSGVPSYSSAITQQPARIVEVPAGPARTPREKTTPELTLYPNGNVTLNAAMARACRLHPQHSIDLEVPSRHDKGFYLDTRKTATRRLHFDIQEGSKFTCSRRLGYVFPYNTKAKKIVFVLEEEVTPGYFKLARL